MHARTPINQLTGKQLHTETMRRPSVQNLSLSMTSLRKMTSPLPVRNAWIKPVQATENRERGRGSGEGKIKKDCPSVEVWQSRATGCLPFGHPARIDEDSSSKEDDG